MPQIVFLTVFLGLVTGLQSISLQVDPAVKFVRLELGGEQVATMNGPPWSARVDLGTELIPRELTAIGYDAEGVEITRASQVLNLPRPIAELAIVIKSDSEGNVARLVGRHLTYSAAVQAKLSVDAVPVPVNPDFGARLPSLDWSRPRVISAEMRFADGQTARREVVIQGGFSDSVGSELTPILVTRTSDHQPQSLDGCFTAEGAPLRVGAIEKTTALVIVVKDPDASDVLARLQPLFGRSTRWWEKPALLPELQLERDTKQRIQWPVSKRFSAMGEPTAVLFEPSDNFWAGQGGISWLLSRELQPRPDPLQPRQFADAVSVAGISALSNGSRRAVVLLLSRTPDQSRSSPAVVRRYLERIGVPLFVWSLEGPRPDLAADWGPVDDISTRSGLSDATGRLNRTIQAQRIVWAAINPLAALKVEGSERCGLRPVARME